MIYTRYIPNIWLYKPKNHIHPDPSPHLGDACFHIIWLQKQAEACETGTALTVSGAQRRGSFLKITGKGLGSGRFIAISWERGLQTCSFFLGGIYGSMNRLLAKEVSWQWFIRKVALLLRRTIAALCFCQRLPKEFMLYCVRKSCTFFTANAHQGS